MSQKLKPLKFAASLVITIILTLGFSISLQSLFAAWTAPNANPPENNVTDFLVSGGLGVGNMLSVAGTSTLAVDDGNVGIGTTTPNSQLHLYQNNNVFNAEIAIQSGNGTMLQNKWSIYNSGLDGTGSLRFWNTSSGNALTILINSNIGIGTTTPSEKLEVIGKIKATSLQITGGTPTAGKVLTSDANGNATWSATAAVAEVDGIIGNEITNTTNTSLTRSGSGTALDPYTIGLNLANVNTWTAQQVFNGNVGIGVATPSYKLDVNGVINGSSVLNPTYAP